ncbi:NucA/NucB deoxyribonuclease domain-containing protein [Streptomyces tendae]
MIRSRREFTSGTEEPFRAISITSESMYREDDLRLRRGIAALAAAVTVMGGMTAAATPSGSDGPAKKSAEVALQQKREAKLNGPRAVPQRKSIKGQKSCEDVQREALASGEGQALCVDQLDAEEARKQLKSSKSVMADGDVWCDSKEMGTPYVTRVSICQKKVFVVTLIDTNTGEPLGTAYLTTAQEINTREVDGKPLPLPGSFHEDLWMQVQAASGVLAAGFTVEIDSDCAPTSQCDQSEGPWTGPQPVTVLSVLEGTWNRVWKEPVGNATMSLGYTITIGAAGKKASTSWGVSESDAWEVRCDKQVGTAIGCIVPAFVPTFVVNYLKYPAGSDYIADAQAFIQTHPGRDDGEPLHREASALWAERNRQRVCDRTFKREDNFNGQYEIQCDEYPFARTKESGGRLDINRGSDCKQFMADKPLPVGEPSRNHTMLSLLYPNGPANCARASMIKQDNEGIGGDLGRFFVSQRVLDFDPFWVDAMSWHEYCGCIG